MATGTSHDLRTAAARGTAAPREPVSSAANSAAEAKRSAGSFSSAVKTASSTCAGTRSRRATIGPGFSVITFATIACAVGPVNGGSPSSISYSTHPKAYTSAFGVISRSPIACSGLM